MVFTRAEANAAFSHVITVVLCETETGTIASALKENGYTDIRNLMSIRPSDIETLSYITIDGTQKALNKGEQGLIRAFLAFIGYRDEQGNPIDNKWTEITVNEFDIYRTGPEFRTLNMGVGTLATTTLGTPTGSSS